MSPVQVENKWNKLWLDRARINKGVRDPLDDAISSRIYSYSRHGELTNSTTMVEYVPRYTSFIRPTTAWYIATVCLVDALLMLLLLTRPTLATLLAVQNFAIICKWRHRMTSVSQVLHRILSSNRNVCTALYVRKS